MAFSIITSFIACSQGNRNLNNSPLFDLKKYFEQQATILKTSNPKVQKLIVQNGQAEMNELQNVNWVNELKPFLECDISKPALRNSYIVGSADSACEGCHHVIYVAIDSSQAIRKVDLQMVDDTIIHITIEKSSYSKMVQSEQFLEWKAGNSFTISGKQTIAMGKENEYTIQVKFQK